MSKKTITMKSLLLSFSFFLFVSFSGISQRNCSPVLDSTTVVIKKDTALACGGPSLNYLICPGVKVSYFDNSCTSKFYLENNAEIHFDSTGSYGYARVWAKNWAVLDANFRQFNEFHQETATTIRDTNSVTSPLSGKFVCPTMTFDYSNLPGGVSGCSRTLGLEKVELSEITFVVYPNPASSVLNMRTNQDNFTIKLIDVMGKVVWEGNDTQIDLKYPKGVYFVQLHSKNQILTKKLVIK